MLELLDTSRYSLDLDWRETQQDEAFAHQMGTNFSLYDTSWSPKNFSSMCIKFCHLACSKKDFCLANLQKKIAIIMKFSLEQLKYLLMYNQPQQQLNHSYIWQYFMPHLTKWVIVLIHIEPGSSNLLMIQRVKPARKITTWCRLVKAEDSVFKSLSL